MKINDREIGRGNLCFVIAEAGVNHNGSLDLAFQLVDQAALSGADAVKFQTFKAERLVTPDAPKAGYQKEMTGAAESQYEMLRRLELSEQDHGVLFDYCKQKGILFLSTPFDEASADFLETLGVAAYKVGSGEITNLPLLEHIAAKGKPMIVSTGMSTLGEVEIAVQAVRRQGNQDLILLHCVSNYPADPAEANLRAMHTMMAAFGTPVGFSDHTPGISVALAAVALGACVVEKHFTLDRTLPGPDHRASLEPDELQALVKGIREVEVSLGTGLKLPVQRELDTAAVARKSLTAGRDLAAGEILDPGMVAIKRPGTGLPPMMLPYVVGRRLRQAVKAGALLSLEMLI